ncbi:hypothetical protein [Qingshengfaniella alkalisoli]|nr:hypothetical protein [Qingshengfaniella alkalisoli]
MKSILLGILATVVIAVGAWLVTDNLDTSSQSRYTSDNGSVRLD